jgi:uncharacterized protein YunC (DUF1805 family)
MYWCRKLLLIFLLLPAFAIAAPTQNPVDFVNAFYMDLAKAESVSSISRIEKLKNYFDDNLYQLLLTDDKNREVETYAVCGYIDFDVFVNAQDGGEVVKTVEVVKSFPQILAAVTFTESKSPNLLVQMKMENAVWKITDFLYPDPFTHENHPLIPQLQAAQAKTCKPADLKPEG